MTKSNRMNVTRRDALKLATAGAAAIAGAPFFARSVQAKPASITFSRESAYVPLFDEHVKKVMGPAFQKHFGIPFNYELDAAGGGAVAHLVTIVESKAPVDMAWVQQEWLYRDSLLDVSDIAEEIGKQQGGWNKEIELLSKWQGKWKSVPFGNIGQCMVYRKDWFDAAGVSKFPESWDEFLEAAIKLKKAGHPFGMSMGHGFADNYSWLLPLLWSFGAQVVAKDGKTVTLDSAETAKAVDFVRKLYKEGCIEDCVGWLDIHNNKAFLTGQISCTNNATSILISAKRDLPDLAKNIGHALNPSGPKGRFHSFVPVTYGIFAHTPDPKFAKEALRWIMDKQQVAAWYASGDMYYAPFLKEYDKSPEWDKEPRFRPYQQCLATGKVTSWPAPPDRKWGEVINRFFIPDMFVKACTGASTKQVIADAVAGIKQIYG